LITQGRKKTFNSVLRRRWTFR